ncbi:transglutaminaseTgpA domain-containing protein [Deinococcus sp.]|uniref:transglutaminaseTgpA domain-containing protein n=1 Tax=Deinococcus sp. TaxID=47478 RepID=UPI0025BE044A|nr:transglutaminaseTgpA domain-containing protein [Deinococcus sp.]
MSQAISADLAKLSRRPAGRRSPTLRPTRLGTGFLGLTMLTLVGCINYGLSLGYGLTFLLGGVWIVTSAQAIRAARTLRLSLLPPPQVVAGQTAVFKAQITQEGAGSNVLLSLQAVQNATGTRAASYGKIRARVGSGQTVTVPLPVTDLSRGPLRLTGVQLVALDSFGFWRAALPAGDAPEVLVYPAPETDAPPPPNVRAAGTGNSVYRVSGNDEFAGVRPYLAGDAPRLISWKHAARTGTLMTREFDAPAGTALALDWAATAGPGGGQSVEARLSRMAAWVAQARALGLTFSFSLPGTVLAPGQGDAQARAALSALATFAPLPLPPETPKAQKSPARVLASAPLQFSLLALGFAIVPGVLRYPVWASALIGGLLMYRALEASPARQLRPLPPLVLAPLALAGGLGLNAQYGTLLGQDAGTAILAVLLALKAAETRNVRDAKLLSLLGLFLTSTHYFHSQGPLVALHSIFAAVLLLGALTRWVSPEPAAQPLLGRAGLRAAGRMLGLAAPLALLLFAFFPRPDGPLWQLKLQSGNQTGLADEISAGEFSHLAQNNAVAFRADFAGGPIPPPEQRYWRGPVYENYNGVKWTQLRTRFASPSVDFVPGAATYSYALTLEPTNKPWLLALDTPTKLPANSILTTGFQALTFKPASLRTRYEFQSQAAQLGRRESVERLNFDLYLPAGQSPRALALGQSWSNLPPEKRVQAGLDYVASHGFTYTLDPPGLAEQDRVDHFLFESKRGFCEHYSSAFGFLMRAAGVPTRIVGGYQGGELNPDGNYLIVRQQDAHAWNEVWLQGQGWVRVDPTAVVAPARIKTNLSTALSAPHAATPRPQTSLDQVRLRIDSFQNSWNNWVVSYNGDQQRSLLSRLGISGVGSAPYMLALFALVALLLWPALLLVRRAARPRDPALAALHDLGERLGLPREPGETVTAFTRRAGEAYPAQTDTLQEIARLFNELRYSSQGAGAASPGTTASATLRELREKVRQVRRG